MFNKIVHNVVALSIILLVVFSCENKKSSRQEHMFENPETRYAMVEGWNLFKNGEYLQSLVLTEQIIRDEPNLPEVYFLRGRVFSELKRFEQARDAYERVLELNPEYQGVHFNLGNNLYRQTKFESAIEQYEKELEHSQDPRVYLNMGRVYYRIDQVEKSEQAYRLSLELNELYPDAHYHLADLYLNEGKIEQALNHAREAVKLDDNNPEYAYIAGRALYQLGKNDEAVGYLQEAMQIDPNHYGAHYILGRIYVQRGEREKGRELLDKAESFRKVQNRIEELQILTQEYPNAFKHWIELGDKYREIREFRDALKAYNAASMIQPSNLNLHANVANTYLMLEDTTEAIRLYREILKVDSTLTDIWLNLGVIYANTGEYGQAENAWSNSLKYDPGNRMAKKYLQKLRRMGAD